MSAPRPAGRERHRREPRVPCPDTAPHTLMATQEPAGSDRPGSANRREKPVHLPHPQPATGASGRASSAGTPGRRWCARARQSPRRTAGRDAHTGDRRREGRPRPRCPRQRAGDPRQPGEPGWRRLQEVLAAELDEVEVVDGAMPACSRAMRATHDMMVSPGSSGVVSANAIGQLLSSCLRCRADRAASNSSAAPSRGIEAQSLRTKTFSSQAQPSCMPRPRRSGFR